MIGEISIGGVYLPAVLVLTVAALAMTTALVRLLSIIRVYRIIAARPLVDLSLLVLLLWLSAHVSATWRVSP